MPRSGKLSEHKKFKFGAEPGDVPKCEKIAMLERPGRISPESNRAKSYKRDHVKQANRAVRHKKVVVE